MMKFLNNLGCVPIQEILTWQKMRSLWATHEEIEKLAPYGVNFCLSSYADENGILMQGLSRK